MKEPLCRVASPLSCFHKELPQSVSWLETKADGFMVRFLELQFLKAAVVSEWGLYPHNVHIIQGNLSQKHNDGAERLLIIRDNRVREVYIFGGALRTSICDGLSSAWCAITGCSGPWGARDEERAGWKRRRTGAAVVVWSAVVWQKSQSSSDLAAPAKRVTNRLIRRNVKSSAVCSLNVAAPSILWSVSTLSSAPELAYTPPAWASFSLQGEFFFIGIVFKDFFFFCSA